jgi:hypothetical protein
LNFRRTNFFLFFFFFFLIIIVKQVTFAFNLYSFDFFPKFGRLNYVFENRRAFFFFFSNERNLYE